MTKWHQEIAVSDFQEQTLSENTPLTQFNQSVPVQLGRANAKTAEGISLLTSFSSFGLTDFLSNHPSVFYEAKDDEQLGTCLRCAVLRSLHNLTTLNIFKGHRTDEGDK